MSDNVCIPYPKCKASDIEANGECDKVELKSNKLDTDKCNNEDDPIFNFYKDAHYYKKDNNCYLHSVTYDARKQSLQGFSKDTDHLICVNKNGEHDSTMDWPNNAESCNVDFEPVKCKTQNDRNW